jgi:hypothetical protein
MSSPPLRVFLTQNQEESLFELSKSTTVPQRTRDRASAIRLSSLGWKVDKIAIYLKWSKSTVREAIHHWKNCGLIGLWDAPREGRKMVLIQPLIPTDYQMLVFPQREVQTFLVGLLRD